MNYGHNPARLELHILALSLAPDFKSAKQEWDLVHIEFHEEWDNCPCGQEIKEMCFIRNRLTGNETHVGNVCINRFLDIATGSLFAGLRKIMEDEAANANEELIAYADRMGYLFDKELGFLRSTARKRNLSTKQLLWKMKINRRIKDKIVVRRRTMTSPANI